MGKATAFIKAATTVVATTVTILGALRENPALSDGVTQTIEKIKTATNSENPKIRFDGKLTAIEACADAVDETFPNSPEPAEWRKEAKRLRLRGELAWTANQGSARKKAMKSVTAEATSLLEKINARLVNMADPALEGDTGPVDSGKPGSDQ